MKKIKLTESELTRLIKRVINEQEQTELPLCSEFKKYPTHKTSVVLF